jgi:hypothetical protein
MFYWSQLPRALQVDGALGLSLEQRAQLASEARYTLRLYSRERCRLPGRLLARAYDGMRSMLSFGYWSSEGMTWPEVKRKYTGEARRALGEDASEEALMTFVYTKVLQKSCSTNPLFDQLVSAPYQQQPGQQEGQEIEDAWDCTLHTVRDSAIDGILYSDSQQFRCFP